MNEITIEYAERRAKAIDLLGDSCVVCGTTDRLEFDHILNDREDKKHTVAYLLRSRRGWDKVVAEVEKCQLLCRICHQQKSLYERGYDTSGRHGLCSTYKKGCRCDECKTAVAEYRRKHRQQMSPESRAVFLGNRRAKRKLVYTPAPRKTRTIVHGTATGWRYGCRCKDCSEVNKARMREYHLSVIMKHKRSIHE